MSPDAMGPAGTAPPEPDASAEEHPRGTLFLMLLLLVAMLAMWGYIFVLMIQAS